MQASKSTELVDCVLQRRRDFFYSISALSPLPGAAFQYRAHTTLYCSGIEDALCNGLVSLEENDVPSENEIQEAIAFFKERKLPFIWWSDAKILEKYHFQHGGMLTGIAVDLSKNSRETVSHPSNITVEIIHSKEDLQTFSTLLTQTFEMAKTAADQLHIACECTMERGTHVHFLARIDGVPAGTATLSVAPSSAGIWSLGTLPKYRRKGIGLALLEAALIEAQKQGQSHVMAILMPKGMAGGIFKKRGFQEVCQFPFYVYGASAESLE